MIPFYYLGGNRAARAKRAVEEQLDEIAPTGLAVSPGSAAVTSDVADFAAAEGPTADLSSRSAPAHAIATTACLNRDRTADLPAAVAVAVAVTTPATKAIAVTVAIAIAIAIAITYSGPTAVDELFGWRMPIPNQRRTRAKLVVKINLSRVEVDPTGGFPLLPNGVVLVTAAAETKTAGQDPSDAA